MLYLWYVRNSPFRVRHSMSGRPVTNRMAAELRRRTLERFDDPNATVLDYCADWVASGQTMAKLARELEVSHSLVMTFLRHEHGTDVVRDVMRDARETGAHVLAEQSIDIADAATPDDVQVARLRAGTRQWVAERWNARELASKSATTAVQINVGALLLDALRQPIESLRAIESARTPEPKLLTEGKSAT